MNSIAACLYWAGPGEEEACPRAPRPFQEQLPAISAVSGDAIDPD
ncbi:hypothetical protein HMPREF9946_02114 [Acetobacteraceae bacterium AT-5844]|nr:hypothetical protein HMPREF9946_02114 [Acetobacteraceae bacterium AT-5844]